MKRILNIKGHTFFLLIVLFLLTITALSLAGSVNATCKWVDRECFDTGTNICVGQCNPNANSADTCYCIHNTPTPTPCAGNCGNCGGNYGSCYKEHTTGTCVTNCKNGGWGDCPGGCTDPTSTPKPPPPAATNTPIPTATPRPPTATPVPPTSTLRPPTPGPPTATPTPPTCKIRPACLDVFPHPCLLPEPEGGWCPITPTITPVPGCIKKPQGDANCDGAITITDYLYYVAAVNGGRIPATVNPDFNGDGKVDAADRTIIVNTLNQ